MAAKKKPVPPVVEPVEPAETAEVETEETEELASVASNTLPVFTLLTPTFEGFKEEDGLGDGEAVLYVENGFGFWSVGFHRPMLTELGHIEGKVGDYFSVIADENLVAFVDGMETDQSGAVYCEHILAYRQAPNGPATTLVRIVANCDERPDLVGVIETPKYARFFQAMKSAGADCILLFEGERGFLTGDGDKYGVFYYAVPENIYRELEAEAARLKEERRQKATAHVRQQREKAEAAAQQRATAEAKPAPSVNGNAPAPSATVVSGPGGPATKTDDLIVQVKVADNNRYRFVGEAFRLLPGATVHCKGHTGMNRWSVNQEDRDHGYRVVQITQPVVVSVTEGKLVGPDLLVCNWIVWALDWEPNRQLLAGVVTNLPTQEKEDEFLARGAGRHWIAVLSSAQFEPLFQYEGQRLGSLGLKLGPRGETQHGIMVVDASQAPIITHPRNPREERRSYNERLTEHEQREPSLKTTPPPNSSDLHLDEEDEIALEAARLSLARRKREQERRQQPPQSEYDRHPRPLR